MGRLQLRALAAILIFAVFLLAIYFPAFAGPPPVLQEAPSAAVMRVVETERAFAALSLEKGMKAAFLANLAPDAVVFRPGPVPAVAWFRDHPAATGTLTWEPDFAAASQAGDMGYTCGPWEYREPGEDSAAYGHFVTVWRRQADGSLKVAIDAGVRHERSRRAVRLVYGSRSVAALDRPVDESVLLAADRQLNRTPAAASSWVNNWLARAAADVRLYRPERAPIVGKEEAAAVLRAAATEWTWKPAGASLSAAGDLGYTYGTCERAPGSQSAAESAAYLRIWRLRQDAGHEIVLDLLSPLPPPKQKL